MTQHRSMILAEIRYKLTVMAHCKKTYNHPKAYPDTQNMMLRQSKNIDSHVICMIDGDQRLNKQAQKIKDELGLAGWLCMVRAFRG